MFEKYFNKTYLINLDRREDRLESSLLEFDKINSSFTRFPAIDGSILDIEIETTDNLRWNKSAYALTLTTIEILKDAIENEYENILIFEDDVEFHPCFDILFDSYMISAPKKYDFLFLGYTNTSAPSTYNTHWDKVRSSFSCHAYAINKHMFKPFLKLLSNLDKPIDYYTNIIIGSRLNSFNSKTKLVYQKNGISDIEGGFYNVNFTR
jgi:GR25 family glycosyltransferase involved in LPS biosynthesis